MRFLWDKSKLEKNLKKHGLHFEIAQLVFDDPHHLSEQDRIENNECRWQTIGMAGSVLIMVGHNFEEKDGEEIIRIITARKATPKERKQYHEA
jgi:uncharacterized protein